MAQKLRAAVVLVGPRFHLQHPHGKLQPSLTPVPGNLMPSYVFSGAPGTYVHKELTCMKAKHSYTEKNPKSCYSNKKIIAGWWWYMFLITALGKQRQAKNS